MSRHPSWRPDLHRGHDTAQGRCTSVHRQGQSGRAFGELQGSRSHCAGNALTAARNTLADGEKIVRVLSFWVYINAEEGFVSHAKLADFGSDYLTEELGEAGSAARAAIGLGTLPGNAPVEIQLICAAGRASARYVKTLTF